MTEPREYETGDEYRPGTVRIRHPGEHVSHAEVGEAYLPHSCQEWRIGGPEAVRALIVDLHAILAAMEAEP